MSKEDRGWSTESHEQYMARRRAEEKEINKGTYEYSSQNKKWYRRY